MTSIPGRFRPLLLILVLPNLLAGEAPAVAPSAVPS